MGGTRDGGSVSTESSLGHTVRSRFDSPFHSKNVTITALTEKNRSAHVCPGPSPVSTRGPGRTPRTDPEPTTTHSRRTLGHWHSTPLDPAWMGPRGPSSCEAPGRATGPGHRPQPQERGGGPKTFPNRHNPSERIGKVLKDKSEGGGVVDKMGRVLHRESRRPISLCSPRPCTEINLVSRPDEPL